MTAESAAQATTNGHAVTTYPVGYCQKFVRDQCWRVPSLYGSAIDAWNGARHKHPGDRNPPHGAPCYYRGGNYGHAVIYCKPGHAGIRSTDCPSSSRVTDTDIGWPERAWGYEYLGWTEDINGVVVIAGEDEDMPISDHDLERIAGRVNHALGDYTADGDKRDGQDKPERADVRLRHTENTVHRLENKVENLEKVVQRIAKAVGA